MTVLNLLQVASNENLKSIDQKLVDAGRFLKSYAADERKKECFEVFVECQKIVEWIRMLGDKQGSEKGGKCMTQML